MIASDCLSSFVFGPSRGGGGRKQISALFRISGRPLNTSSHSMCLGNRRAFAERQHMSSTGSTARLQAHSTERFALLQRCAATVPEIHQGIQDLQ